MVPKDAGGSDDTVPSWIETHPLQSVMILTGFFAVVVALCSVAVSDAFQRLVTSGGILIVMAGVIIVGGHLWAKGKGAQTATAIAAAIAAAAAAGLLVWPAVPTVTRTVIRRSPPRLITVMPASVTIAQPEPAAIVGPTLTISGTVANLGRSQYVWEYSQPYTSGTPGTGIHPGQRCDVSGSSFTCANVFDGNPAADYCRMALLWVAVVSANQDRWLATHFIDVSSPGAMSVTWPAPPPRAEGGYDSVLVQRRPAAGHGACAT
jgi:hypothetical protein